MYGDQTLRYTFTPIVIKEIWFHLVAWDEEMYGRDPVPGGDRTKVEVYMDTKLDSNADAQNPTLIESEGQKFERRVCEINCYLPKTWTHWMCLFMRDLRAIASSWILAHERMTGLATTI